MIALTNTPTLQTDRLTLRAPNAQDWPHWRDFATSQRAEFIGGPYDLNGAWRAFGHAVGHWVLRGFGSFAVTLKGDDTAIGMTGPWYPIIWPEKELGWTIWNPDFEGTGLMFEAASAARDYAFNTLKWATAVSYIDHGNDRSVALAERLGAVLDETAAQPKSDRPCLIYRHPTPGAA